MSIQVGQKGHAETVVTAELTARVAGSGALDVFATPHMVALMEQAAWTSIQPSLEAGQGSVGVAMTVTHDAATPMGMNVWAESEVTAVDGRKVSFSVTAFDECGTIGTATHQRVIIDNEKFFSRCQSKGK
jgi:predicted thioesterase